jgi:hypothetical protein
VSFSTTLSQPELMGYKKLTAISYLGLTFDQTKYNMGSIPMSSSKRYGQPSFRPSETGLARYFDVFLRPMMQVPITRFVLIDHSSTGKSVDGFRRAFLDMVYYYGLEQGQLQKALRRENIFLLKFLWFSST